MVGIAATMPASVRQGREFGGGEPDSWARERQLSLTGGSTDTRGPPGSDDGEGNGCGLSSQWTGPDGATDFGPARRNQPTRIFQNEFPFLIDF
jgi:hypothetical protein